MKMVATLLVSPDTAARLAGAGEECGHSMARQAALIVAAAARLHTAGRGASAMPPVSVAPNGTVPVAVAMTDDICSIVAHAAADRGVTIEDQIRAALDAGVAGYKPPRRQVERRVIGPPAPEALPPRPKAKPTRPPFDAAYYARHAIAFRV